MLFLSLLVRVMGRRRRLLHPMIDIRPARRSNSMRKTLLLLAQTRSIVNWTRTAVILQRHLEYGCLREGNTFFLGEGESEGSSSAIVH